MKKVPVKTGTFYSVGFLLFMPHVRLCHIEACPFAYDLAQVIVVDETEVSEVYIVADVQVSQVRVEVEVEHLQLVVADIQSLEEVKIAQCNVYEVVPFKIYKSQHRNIAYSE